MDILSLKNFLEDKSIKYLPNLNLAEYSNTGTGGTVPLAIYPKDETELVEAIAFTKNQRIRYYVLGDMTNVAISSGSLNFIVIFTGSLNAQPIYDSHTKAVSVGAGYRMKDLSRWALQHSLAGMQWMEGIPGTVGAGTFMNAGFLPGQEFASFLIDAKVLMANGSIKTYSNKDMHYAYRESALQTDGGIVLSVRLLVRTGKKWKINLRMKQYHHRRAKNQPLELPSAGTVFVQPIPYHVGGFLREQNLAGYRIGGAEISPKSPGFIVGVDHMTGEDYFHLVRFIQEKIHNQYGISLVPEVRLLGFSENKNE